MVAKTNRYTILIVILSVLLAISLIVGSTFAWFASSDAASRTIILGDPVKLNIVDSDNNVIEGDGFNLPITIPGNKLLPGMQVNVLARVLFDQSNTPALLRAKIGVTVENSNASTQDITSLETQLNLAMQGSVETTGFYKWVYNSGDGWWYYLGENNIETTVNQSELKRIVNTGATASSRTVDFISDSFIFPYTVGNTFAKSDIVFAVEFQGVQGYLPAYDEPALIGENEFINGEFTTFRINKIANVIAVFEEAFT